MEASFNLHPPLLDSGANPNPAGTCASGIDLASLNLHQTRTRAPATASRPPPRATAPARPPRSPPGKSAGAPQATASSPSPALTPGTRDGGGALSRLVIQEAPMTLLVR